MSITAAETKLDESAVGRLEGRFRGELVRPSDPTYDQHRRIWNGSIDRRPGLIARCAGVADVIQAVRFGRRTGVPIVLNAARFANGKEDGDRDILELMHKDEGRLRARSRGHRGSPGR